MKNSSSSSSSSANLPEVEEEGEKPRCEWDLSLSAVVSCSSAAATLAADAIGAIEFDPTGDTIVTGGIARKLRFYRLGSFPDSGFAVLDHVNAAESCICTPAKLSSLKWRPGLGSRVLGAGDYDGVVTEYDTEKLVPVFERDEHGGRRIWSVDYTNYTGPAVGASGSDDGTFQTWDSRTNGGLDVTVRPGGGSAICSVEFDPLGGPNLAVGCADRRAYVYDIRRLVDPVVELDGHTKTVTYARFLNPYTVVTASTDGCLKLWDITNGRRRVVRTYRGHVNGRNFVGLSVWRHGRLFVSGSESNEVFVYDKRWGEPVWVHGSGPSCPVGSDQRFVSSVCWRQVDDDRCTLVTGGSDGVLQVFAVQKKG